MSTTVEPSLVPRPIKEKNEEKSAEAYFTCAR